MTETGREKMTREEAEKITTGYDAKRYAREVPDKLLKELGKVPIADELELSRADEHAYASVERRREQADLTERQRQCVELASHGMTNAMIGQELGLSLGTVQTHMKRATFVLAAKNRTHTIAIALRRGMIQ